MADNPKVFISYSHDDVRFQDQVLKFSDKLRSDGIDAELDQYETSPKEGWPLWMEKQIREADYVLVVCTEKYYQNFTSKKYGQASGVAWEVNLICQALYDAGSCNKKFIPVLFNDGRSEHIITPLKGATFYNVDNITDYDSLYSHLTGNHRVEKPPLGKLRAIQKKERKSLFVLGFINAELWNKAKWIATAFIYDQNNIAPPVIGIVFKDKEAATMIFQGWLNRIGENDKYNELRVAIVEGEIPGEESGYTVIFGVNVYNVVARMKIEEIDVNKDLFLTVSRLNRMHPDPNSKNLELFKNLYKKFGAYFIVPVVINENGEYQFNMELRIQKQELELKNIESIVSSDDPEAFLIPEFAKKNEKTSWDKML